MVFHSFAYALFFILVFLVYWKIPARFRWIALLVSSYVFYASWGVGQVAVIALTTLLTYAAGRLLQKENPLRKDSEETLRGGKGPVGATSQEGIAEEDSGRPVRKLLLIVAITACVGTLFVFKYFDFFSRTLADILNGLSFSVTAPTLSLVAPIGISFYLFQSISYLVDVYRERIPAERHLGIYAVYISFFPKVLEGPIERGECLLPQLKEERSFSYQEAAYGIKLMAWGYFKKLVLSDGLSAYVDQVYGSVTGYTGFALVLATFFYAIQLYCDFSGYTDIALGSARLLGIRLTDNFASPYFASSIKEFWGRWHISLSSWLRDYIYIPLGGNRVGRLRHALNIMVTFLISGLWHGASWTYVLWGGLHGAYQLLEAWFPWNRKKKDSSRHPEARPLLHVFTVPLAFVMVCLAWVLFRADSVGDALYVFTHLFDGIASPLPYLKNGLLAIGISNYHALLYRLIPLVLLFVYDLASLKTDVIALISGKRFYIRWTVYILLLLIILLFSDKGVTTSYIYMQF